MEKDMAGIRETDAKKEQTRIDTLQTQKEAEKEKQVVEKIRASSLEQKQRVEEKPRDSSLKIKDSIVRHGQGAIIANLPNPPSTAQKIIIRLLFVAVIVFVAFNIALFGYSYFFKKDEGFRWPFFLSFLNNPQPTPSITETPTPSPTGEPTSSITPTPSPTGEPNSTPTPQTLKEILKPRHTSTIQFSDPSTLETSLSQFFKEKQGAGFTHLIFRKEADQTVINLEEFSSLFKLTIPSGVSSQIIEPTLFFLYSYERGNRFGFVAKIADPIQTRVAMKSWESAMENAVNSLRSFWWQGGAVYTKTFRTRLHGGTSIIYQTFSLNDIGVVYSIKGNYLIFTSSFEAAKAALDRLP